MRSNIHYCNENAIPRDPNLMKVGNPSHHSPVKNQVQHPPHHQVQPEALTQELYRSNTSTPVSLNFDREQDSSCHRRTDMSTVSLSPLDEGISPIRISALLDMPMEDIEITSTEELEDSNHSHSTHHGSSHEGDGSLDVPICSRQVTPHHVTKASTMNRPSDPLDVLPLLNKPPVHDSPVRSQSSNSSTSSKEDTNEAPTSAVPSSVPQPTSHPHPAAVHPAYPPHGYMHPPAYGAHPPAAMGAYPPAPYAHYHPHVAPYFAPPPPGSVVPPPGAPVAQVAPPTVAVEQKVKSEEGTSKAVVQVPTSASSAPPSVTKSNSDVKKDLSNSDKKKEKLSSTKNPATAPVPPHPATAAGYPHPPAGWPYPGAPPPHYAHAMYPPPPGYPHPMIHPMYHPGAYYGYPPVAPAAAVQVVKKEKGKVEKLQVKEETKEKESDTTNKANSKEVSQAASAAEVPSSLAKPATGEIAVPPPPHAMHITPHPYHLYPHPPPPHHPQALPPHPHFPAHMHGLHPAGPYTACQRTLELARRKEKARRNKKSKKSRKDRSRKSSKSSRLDSKAIFRSKAVVDGNMSQDPMFQQHQSLQISQKTMPCPNGISGGMGLSVRPSHSTNVPVTGTSHISSNASFSQQSSKTNSNELKNKIMDVGNNENCNVEKVKFQPKPTEKKVVAIDKAASIDTSNSSANNGELSPTTLERRARKNSQSRLRAARLKERISIISNKNPAERTEEEVATLELYEKRRERKNGRSRERAVERKREMDRIMKKPESEWTNEEKEFVEETMIAKYKKNEGDRMRRKKLKDMREGSKPDSLRTGSAKKARSSSRGRNSNDTGGACISTQISNVSSQDDCSSKPFQDLSGITLDNEDGELDLVQAFRGSIENMWNEDLNNDRLSPTFMLFRDGDINDEQMDAPFLTPVTNKNFESGSSSGLFGSSKTSTNQSFCSSGRQNFVLPTPPASHRQIDSILNGSSILSTIDDTSETDEWPAHLMMPFSKGEKGAQNLSSPLTLPRRPALKMSYPQTSEGRTISMSEDHDEVYETQFRKRGNVGHRTEPIAVSFSVDTV